MKLEVLTKKMIFSSNEWKPENGDTVIVEFDKVACRNNRIIYVIKEMKGINEKEISKYLEKISTTRAQLNSVIANATKQDELTLSSYYFSENYDLIVVKAEEYFFVSKLNTEAQDYFKEIIDLTETQCPNIEYIRIYENLEFCANIERNLPSNKKIKIYGKIFQYQDVKGEFNDFSSKLTVRVLLPPGKTIEFIAKNAPGIIVKPGFIKDTVKGVANVGLKVATLGLMVAFPEYILGFVSISPLILAAKKHP